MEISFITSSHHSTSQIRASLEPEIRTVSDCTGTDYIATCVIIRAIKSLCCMQQNFPYFFFFPLLICTLFFRDLSDAAHHNRLLWFCKSSVCAWLKQRRDNTSVCHHHSNTTRIIPGVDTASKKKGTVGSFISSQAQPDPPLLEHVQFPVKSTWILWEILLPSNLSRSEALSCNAPSEEKGRSNDATQGYTQIPLKKKKKKPTFSLSLLQHRFFFLFDYL